MQDVKDYIESYVAFSDPIPYKELLIYPVKVKDITRFENNIGLFTIEKNKIPSVEIIRMTYLEFMYNMLVSSDDTIDNLIEILDICFGVQFDENFYNEKYDKGIFLFKQENSKMIITINGYNFYFLVENEEVRVRINSIELDDREFNDVKRIIMYQNYKDFDDSEMDDDFKKAVEEYYAIKNKNLTFPNLEKKIDYLILHTSYTEDKIKELTYRRFEAIFNLSLEETDYKVTKSAEMGGMVKFKNPVEHFMYKEKKNKYADAFTSEEGFRNKMSSVT